MSGLENYTAPTTGTNYFFDLVQNETTDNTLKALHVNSLFNGNIRSLTGAISPVHSISMRGFLYDQANRLKAAATFTGYDNTNNKIDVDNFARSTKYFEQFSYDGNGNIMTLTRNDQDGSTMDELAYTYYDGSNRLEHVENTGTSSNTNKVNTQATNNYEYDHIGNMVKDVSSDIAHIDWNVQGKIWKITHTTGSTHPDLEFKYDPMGHRLCKIVKHGPHQEDGWDYTYYVRDAQGQELATYTKAIATDPAHTDKYKATYQLQQNDLYGSKRLGVLQRSQLLTTATNTIGGHNADGTITETTTPAATPVTATEGSYAHHAGTRYYELTNHLGNVLATIKDIKIPHDDNTDGVTDYYTASVAGANDYYSFGSIMPNANNKTNDDYNFGFNGKRNDNEIKGVGNSLDFGERVYDPRIVVWGSVDPLARKYASISPYVFCANNPILFLDPNGKDLRLGGKMEQSLLDIQSLVPSDLRSCITLENNKVIFNNYKDLPESVKQYEGVKLLNNMINSESMFHYRVDNRIGGYKRNDVNQPVILRMDDDNYKAQGAINNLSKTARTDYPIDHQANLLPDDPYDGSVRIADGEFGKVGADTRVGYNPIDRNNVVFHELSENFERTDNCKDYDDAHNASVKKGDKFSQEVNGKPDHRAGEAQWFTPKSKQNER